MKIDSFSLIRCRNCRLMWLEPRGGGTHTGDYQSSLQIETYVDYMKPMRQRQYREELAALQKFADRGKLLDVGCALGWFLGEATRCGYQADGLEPQADLGKIAAVENPTSRVLLGDLEALSGVDGEYDIISLWSVIEHFSDPESAIDVLKKALKTGGLLAIRTPNSLGLAERASMWLFKGSGGRIRVPIDAVLQLGFESKHWWLFSPRNLSMLIRRRGFRPTSVYYSSSVDRRNFGLWLRSRNIRVSKLLAPLLQLALLGNDIASRPLRLADDFVLFAVKEDAGGGYEAASSANTAPSARNGP